MKKNNNFIILLKYLLIFLYVFLLYMFGGNNSFTYTYKIPMIAFIILELFDILIKGKIKIANSIIILFLFSFYALLSSTWAINYSLSITTFSSIFFLAIFVLLIFNFLYYEDNGCINYMKILMIAGLLFSIYIILYYGVFDYFTLLSKGVRIGTEIDNVNMIGIETSITYLIILYFSINYNKKYSFLLFLPFIIALGTGSRKTLFILLCGTVLLLLSTKSKNEILGLLKKTVIVLGVIIGLYLFFRLFQSYSIISRLEGLFNAFSGKGIVDNSTKERQLFIKYGLEQFYKKPLFGIGVGNSGYITLLASNRFTYLHNNYVDLLATLGLIGFIIFYSFYIIQFKSILKMKNNNLKRFIIILIIILLILDFGSTTYYIKSIYLYLLLLVLASNTDKKTCINGK